MIMIEMMNRMLDHLVIEEEVLMMTMILTDVSICAKPRIFAIIYHNSIPSWKSQIKFEREGIYWQKSR